MYTTMQDPVEQKDLVYFRRDLDELKKELKEWLTTISQQMGNLQTLLSEKYMPRKEMDLKLENIQDDLDDLKKSMTKEIDGIKSERNKIVLGILGGFKRSSQHGLFRLIVGTGPGPRREFSSLA